MKKSLLVAAAVLAVCTPAYAGTNGALATAVWRAGDGRAHAKTGLATRNGQDEADAEALSQCGDSHCKITGRFSEGGCGYVTAGKSSDGRSVGIGGGATAAAALAKCQGQGLNCQTPAGACTSHTVSNVPGLPPPPPPSHNDTNRIRDELRRELKQQPDMDAQLKCATAVFTLTAHSIAQNWLATELARSGCKPNGSPMD